MERCGSTSEGESGTADAAPAIVRVDSVRTAGWRGWFSVHCWVTFREAGTQDFHCVEVWGFRSSSPEVIRWRVGVPGEDEDGLPARRLGELRGPAAERAIAGIRAAVRSYAYPIDYRGYPGPNSNTFVSHLLRSVDAFGIALPPTAIGKDWLGRDLVARTESGTGLQFSVLGMFGLALGLVEGLELNLLGLVFGVDLLRPALKLPLLGRVGCAEGPLFWR